MDIYFNSKKISKNNLFLTINETSNSPNINIIDRSSKLYTLLMFDPEAVGGNKIHWLMVNITNYNINYSDIIFNYKGPMPPKGSGTHHYVFCLMKQKTHIIPIKIKDRFIELDNLFKKLNFYANNKMKIISIKCFLSKNL